MKNLLVIFSTLCLLAGVALADAKPVVTVDGVPACAAQDLDVAAKNKLNRWIALNKKLDAGNLTKEEQAEGYILAATGQCVLLRPNIPAKVIVFDGVDLLIKLCTQGECVQALVKKEGLKASE